MRYDHWNMIDFPIPLHKRGAAEPASSSDPQAKRRRFEIKAADLPLINPKGPPTPSMRGQASSSPGRQVKRLPPGHPMPPGMPTAPTAPVPFARKVVPRLSAPDADAPLPLLDAVAPLPVLVLQPIPPLQPPPTFPPIPLTPQQVAELPAIDADGVMIIDAPPAAVARWPPADPSSDE